MLLAQTAIGLNTVLLFLHVLPAMLACGGLVAATLLASVAGTGAAGGLRKVLSIVEYSLYALFVFGAIMGFTQQGAGGKMLIAAPWLSISMLLWIIMVGVLHAMVRKPVRTAAVGERTSTLAAKARTGLMVMNVLWVVTLVFMIFKIPG